MIGLIEHIYMELYVFGALKVERVGIGGSIIDPCCGIGTSGQSLIFPVLGGIFACLFQVVVQKTV